MKKSKFYLCNIIIALLVINNIEMFAQNTYYISSSDGDDRNDGQSGIPTDGNHGPWKTIDKLHSINLTAGDKILLKKGDSWNKSLTINSSGNATSPITYSAYGSGSLPKINCAEEITNWELYDTVLNIWRSKIDTNYSSISQLFVNGERQTIARWPNSGWNIIDETSENGYYLVDNELIQPENYWNGATLVIRGVMWEILEKEISASNIHMLNWDSELPYNGKATVDFGYYIENKFEELDNAGEYFFDKQNNMLYLFLENGIKANNVLIEASTRENGIYLNLKKHVTISNLNIIKAAKNALVCYNSNNIKIEGCSLLDSKVNGMIFFSSSGHNLILEGNTVKNIDQGRGIQIYNIKNTEMVNNIITDINSDLASPRSESGIYISGSPNSKIQNNKIKNIGGHGIHIVNGPVNVSGNFLSNCGYTVQDNGAIYLNGNHTGSIIEYNQIKDCIGNNKGFPDWAEFPGTTVGLYSDENAFGAVFSNNVVVNCSYGIHLHKSYNTTIVNNVFYNSRATGISLQETASNQMHENRVYNNISSGRGSSLAMRVSRAQNSNTSIGSFNNNIFYNPDLTKNIAYGYSQYYSLVEWQDKTGNDSGNDSQSLSIAPLFVNGEDGDFQLQSNSPCIDAGNNAYMIAEKDFYGKVRIWDGNMDNDTILDIGASEYGAPCYIIEIDSNICEGENVLIGSQEFISTGNYTILLQNNNSCDSIVKLNLTVNPIYSTKDTLTICKNDLPYDYFGNKIPIETSSKKIEFLFKTFTDCDSIVKLDLTVLAIDTSVRIIGDTLIANAINSKYQWLDCNNNYLSIPGATNQTFIPTKSGRYALEVSNKTCKDTSACFNVLNSSVNIFFNCENSVTVYPNPTKGKIIFDTGEFKQNNFQIKVVNTQGQEFECDYIQLDDKILLNLSQRKPGLYIIKIDGGNEGKATINILKK